MAVPILSLLDNRLSDAMERHAHDNDRRFIWQHGFATGCQPDAHVTRSNIVNARSREMVLSTPQLFWSAPEGILASAALVQVFGSWVCIHVGPRNSFVASGARAIEVKVIAAFPVRHTDSQRLAGTLAPFLSPRP